MRTDDGPQLDDSDRRRLSQPPPEPVGQSLGAIDGVQVVHSEIDHLARVGPL